MSNCASLYFVRVLIVRIILLILCGKIGSNGFPKVVIIRSLSWSNFTRALRSVTRVFLGNTTRLRCALGHSLGSLVSLI